MQLPQKNSLSYRVLISTLAVSILISLSLGAFSVFSRYALLNQASSNNRVYTELLAGQLDHSLYELRDYMEQLFYMDPSFARMAQISNREEQYLLAQDFSKTVQKNLPLYPFEIIFYISGPGLHTPVISIHSEEPYSTTFSDFYHEWKDNLTPPEESSAEEGLYQPVLIGSHHYLSLLYHKNDVYFGVFVGCTSLMSTLKYAKNIEYTYIALQDEEDHLLGETEQPVSNRKKEVILSSCPLTCSPIYLNVSVPQKAFVREMEPFQILLTILTILSLITFLLYFLFQQWKISRPLRELRQTLKQIEDGQLSTRLDSETGTREISEIYRTINTYIDHVTALRTQTYEERLNRQSIELQFLQLQLRPHFFLNSLKGIYALAESHEYSEIQEYVLCLSNHFRFLLYDTTKRIELKRELMHTQNYMQMQRISLHKADIRCDFQMSGVNENTLVPPLILQTFMENSIKYAMRPNQPLFMEIHVQALEMEDGRNMLNFSFRDNGPGFSSQVLQEMEENEDEFFLQHKGFGNLKRRLSLIYPDPSNIYVYNHPSGGAAIEVLIPHQSEAVERKEEAE